ncbi:hypothetical protein [Melissospora conviva]|uniref:hypothetical protein n=1 Tax=Melissospora conviva TaxID=3388432 RepID=UPI003B829348
MTDPNTRWVIHLPVTATDLPRARILARTAARALSFLTELDPGETTVSAEDTQSEHHRAFCDQLLPSGRRCILRAEHLHPCTDRPPRSPHNNRPYGTPRHR